MSHSALNHYSAEQEKQPSMRGRRIPTAVDRESGNEVGSSSNPFMRYHGTIQQQGTRNRYHGLLFFFEATSKTALLVSRFVERKRSMLSGKAMQ